MRIKCPNCNEEMEHGGDLLERGSFLCTCASCNHTWKVSTALTSTGSQYVSDQPGALKLIRKALKKTGFTQAEIGHFLGFSGAYISTLLNGKRKLTHHMALRLLEVAGVHGEEAKAFLTRNWR